MINNEPVDCGGRLGEASTPQPRGFVLNLLLRLNFLVFEDYSEFSVFPLLHFPRMAFEVLGEFYQLLGRHDVLLGEQDPDDVLVARRFGQRAVVHDILARVTDQTLEVNHRLVEVEFLILAQLMEQSAHLDVLGVETDLLQEGALLVATLEKD